MHIRLIAIVVLFIVTMSSSGRGYSLTADNGIGSAPAHRMPFSGIYVGEREVDPANANDLSYWMARDLIERGDLSKGLEMLRSAANSGHPFAMHDLALHLRHTGDQRSLAEAAHWYRLAAEVGGIGFAGSQNNLGDMYENGHGLPKSPGDAIYWYVRSAMQGEPTAYLSLGLCFADGVGVQIDPIEAAFWLLLAVRDLHEGSNRNDASEKLTELRKSMLAEQLEQATKRAEVFMPLRQTKYKIGDPAKRTLTRSAQ